MGQVISQNNIQGSNSSVVIASEQENNIIRGNCGKKAMAFKLSSAYRTLVQSNSSTAIASCKYPRHLPSWLTCNTHSNGDPLIQATLSSYCGDEAKPVYDYFIQLLNYIYTPGMDFHKRILPS